jgi:hypothetical protein
VKEGTHAQVTLLVIVGIVILITIIGVISLRQYLTTDQIQNQAEETLNEFIQVNSLEQYVTSCLDNVAVEGLLLLGEQGGVIYEEQGGLTPFDDAGLGVNHTYFDPTASGNAQRISYAIGDTVDCPLASIFPVEVDLEASYTSEYPVKNVYFSNYATTYLAPYTGTDFPGCNGLGQQISRRSGYLGLNKLPPLCSYNGSNSLEQGAVTCAINHYDTLSQPNSMQRQLESYIAHNLGNCVNFSYYENVFADFNISLRDEEVAVNTILKSPRGITIEANYPFTVSLPGAGAVYQSASFQSSLDVNIRSLYSFIFDIIFNSVRDPFFNIEENYSSLASYSDSFSFERFESGSENLVPLNEFDDVFVFTDQVAEIQGRQFTFQTAIKQRKPALEYMRDPTQSVVYNGQPLDYLFYSNGSVEFYPEAVDPDGDNITFTYYGWKETYDEYFNYTACLENLNGCTIETHAQYIQRIETDPGLLSASTQYTATQQYVGPINLTPEDIGYHEIQILIEDEHGAQDFQTIRFLVFDTPLAIANGSNLYDDINNSYASPEELYQIDASGSVISVFLGDDGTFNSFIFQEENEPFYLETDAALDPLNFNKPWIPFFGSTLLEFSQVVDNFFNKSFYSSLPQEVSITVIAGQDDGTGIGNSIYSLPTTVDVQVVDCLPHGYNATLGTFNSYPLPLQNNGNFYTNLWGVDHFGQPNVCCAPTQPLTTPLQGGNIKPSSEVCFDTEELGQDYIACYPFADASGTPQSLFSDRMNVDVAENDIRMLTPQNYQDAGLGSYNIDLFSGVNILFNRNNPQINDVFSVTQSQRCSGLRGNSCGGEIESDWDVIAPCTDLQPMHGVPNWQIARCSGPGASFFGSTTPLSESSCVGANAENTPFTGGYACHDYTYFSFAQSFEKIFLSSTFSGNYDSFVNEYNPAERNLISNGYCAPFANASIDFSTDTVTVVLPLQTQQAAENFRCAATCGNGECDYTLLSQCSCNRATECSGVSASALNFYEYVCASDAVCTNTCQPEPQAAPLGGGNSPTTKEACYCQATNAPGLNSGTPVNQWFDPANNYQLNGSSVTNQLCCHASIGNTLTTQNFVPGAPVCVAGEQVDHFAIFDSQNANLGFNNGDNRMLSCDGNLFFCGENNVTQETPSNSFTLVPNGTSGSYSCPVTCDGVTHKWI